MVILVFNNNNGADDDDDDNIKLKYIYFFLNQSHRYHKKSKYEVL